MLALHRTASKEKKRPSHSAREAQCRHECNLNCSPFRSKHKRQEGNNCSFCGLISGHYYTWCPKREEHKTNKSGPPFQEHDMNPPGVCDIFIAYIESTMIMSEMFNRPPAGMYGLLNNKWYRYIVLKYIVFCWSRQLNQIT